MSPEPDLCRFFGPVVVLGKHRKKNVIELCSFYCCVTTINLSSHVVVFYFGFLLESRKYSVTGHDNGADITPKKRFISALYGLLKPSIIRNMMLVDNEKAIATVRYTLRSMFIVSLINASHYVPSVCAST